MQRQLLATYFITFLFENPVMVDYLGHARKCIQARAEKTPPRQKRALTRAGDGMENYIVNAISKAVASDCCSIVRCPRLKGQ